MDSILNSTKKLLGITEEYTHFDIDIILHINAVISEMYHLGVESSDGFIVEDEFATWDDLIPDGSNLNYIKTYVYLNVKLLFDPPASSAAITSMEKTISRLEWRINTQAESLNRTNANQNAE